MTMKWERHTTVSQDVTNQKACIIKKEWFMIIRLIQTNQSGTRIEKVWLSLYNMYEFIMFKTYIPVYSTSLDKGLSTRKPIE